MIGWASNWDYANDTPTHPWRSAMSLVREVTLIRCADGRLRLAQRPVLPSEQSDLKVFELSVPSGPGDRNAVVLSADSAERLVITVDGDDRSITCDRTQSGATAFHADFPSVDWAPLPVGTANALDLLIIVDAMIVEIYAGGGLVTITQQVFPIEPLPRSMSSRVPSSAPRKGGRMPHPRTRDVESPLRRGDGTRARTGVRLRPAD